MKTSRTPVVSLSSTDWNAALEELRAHLLRRSSKVRLNVDADVSEPIPSLVLDSDAGARFAPALLRKKSALDAVVESLVAQGGADFSTVDLLDNTVNDAIEAGYLLGLATGTGESWDAVRRMMPPSISEPVKGK